MRGSAGTRGRRTGGRPTGELSQAAARARVSTEKIRQKSPASVEEQHQEGEPGDAEALPGGGNAMKHLRRKPNGSVHEAWSLRERRPALFWNPVGRLIGCHDTDTGFKTHIELTRPAFDTVAKDSTKEPTVVLACTS